MRKPTNTFMLSAVFSAWRFSSLSFIKMSMARATKKKAKHEARVELAARPAVGWIAHNEIKHSSKDQIEKGACRM